MVESINLWPGPSVCMTAEIIAVVGCQRAGLHTAWLPSPAHLGQKPGQEATALDDSSRPRGRFGIARHHVYRHDTRRRGDAVTVSDPFWVVRVLSFKPWP